MAMIKVPLRREHFENYRREIVKIWGPFLFLCIAGLITSYFLFVEPPPPNRIVIATGQKTGGYYTFAEQYRAILARAGIDLQIQETAGSAENIQKLLDPSSGVHVAFVQSGTVPAEAREKLVALGSMYREPLWVFHRLDPAPTRLGELRGKRLSIGAPQSGTRLIALRLLADNGVTPETQAAANAPLVELDDAAAAEALERGRIDAAFLVISPGSPHVAHLLQRPDIHLMSFRRQKSYVRRYPYLSSVTISEGLLDMDRDIPAQDCELVAPSAMLVVSQSLHPALVTLLLEAATAVHDKGSLVDDPYEFPAARFVDLPMSEAARHYIKEGPSLLNRFLPFWLASLVDRLKFMIVPLLTLLFPLFKIAPPLYQWRIRSKIYRHYASLRKLEHELRQGIEPERRAEAIVALRKLEDELSQVSVPLWSMEEIYQLYLHIGHVRRLLEEEEVSTSDRE